MASKYLEGKRRYIRIAGLFALAGVLLASALAATAPVGAATASGSALTTSPVSVSLSTAPGSTVTTNLQLQNNGVNPVSVSIKLEKFKAAGDEGQAQIYVPSTSDPSLDWVHFTPQTFTANPGDWNQVKMTISVPTTAAFGYYYAVLFSPNVAGAPVAGNNTLRGANAVLVLLNVRTPGAKNVLDVASFSSDRRVYQYLPATLSVKVHNSGNVFAAPRGDVYISRTPSGPAFATLPINSSQGNVLPGTDRVFKMIWDDGFPSYQYKRINGQIVSDEHGKPVMQLSWDLTHITKFRFGRYYARLVFVYNDGTRDIPVHSTLSFWVIPWTIIGVLVVLLLVVGLGVWTIVRFMLNQRYHRHIRLR